MSAYAYYPPAHIPDIAAEPDLSQRGWLIDGIMGELERFELYGPSGTGDLVEVIIPADIQFFKEKLDSI